VLFVYVSSAIVGLVLLIASMQGAGHGHAVVHDGEGEADCSPMLALLSVRAWTYLLAFGGATGAALRTLGRQGEPWSAIGALTVGFSAALMAMVFIAKASRAGASGTVHDRTS